MTACAFALISMFSFSHPGPPPGAFGTPNVLKFFGGAKAAISLQFDDSMTTQLANALPRLNERKLRATFFVNTEKGSFAAHRKEWEVDVVGARHDLGNHTAHHSGAKNEADLEKEIGDCCYALGRIYGKEPRLVSFAIPGGVPWNFTEAELLPVLRKYNLVLARNRNFFDEKNTDPISFVQKAIETESWSNVSMHGVGGEWLSTSIPVFTKLLDYLVAERDKVWVAPEIDIYKYTQERDALNPIQLKAKGDSEFELTVTCDPNKLEFHIQPTTQLYDQPLTVEVSVPENWEHFVVYQSGRMGVSYPVVTANKLRIARFSVKPNGGVATIRKFKVTSRLTDFGWRRRKSNL